ncbi:MAG: ADP-ribosylglycohydrolase family protein [Chitinophagales bacterium]
MACGEGSGSRPARGTLRRTGGLRAAKRRLRPPGPGKGTPQPGRSQPARPVPRRVARRGGGRCSGALPRIRRLPHPRWIEYYEPERGYSGSAVGRITDDTQLTMWLAESLLECEGLNPDDVARRFCAQPIRGIGIATAEFVDRYRRGLRWTDAGVKSAGNGVAMRSAPVGLFWPDDYPSLKLGPASRRCSRTTTRWRSPAGS